MFWERLYDLCLKKGCKPNTVAKAIGLSSAIATKWKNGSIPNGEVLAKIAYYFDCSVDYLLGRTNTVKVTHIPDAFLERYEKRYENLKDKFIDEADVIIYTLNSKYIIKPEDMSKIVQIYDIAFKYNAEYMSAPIIEKSLYKALFEFHKDIFDYYSLTKENYQKFHGIYTIYCEALTSLV